MRVCLNEDVIQAPIKSLAKVIKKRLCKWIKKKKRTKLGKLLKKAKSELTNVKNYLTKPYNPPKDNDMEKWASFWGPQSTLFSKYVQTGFIVMRKMEEITVTNDLSSKDLDTITGHVTSSLTGLNNVNGAVLRQVSCFLDETTFGKYLIQQHLSLSPYTHLTL